MSCGIDDLLEFTGGKWVNQDAFEGSKGSLKASGPAPLEGSGPGSVAFFFSKEYRAELLKAAPSVLVTAPPFVGPLSQSGLPLWKKSAVVACEDPYLAMAVLSEKFAPSCSYNAYLPADCLRAPSLIHETAVIDPGAKIGEAVQIGPYVVVEAG